MSSTKPTVAPTGSARLADKVVVITGAGSGMGLAMAARFSREGAAVIGGDIDADRLERLAGLDSVTARIADVSDRQQAAALIDAAIEAHGRIDVLCNNAGIPGRFQPVDETTDEEWDRLIAVNLTGPFACSRAAVPHMLRAGRGSIINTASIAGMRGGIEGAAYSCSKAGVIALTRSIATAYGAEGIRANAICPGAVATGMTEAFQRTVDAGQLSERGWAVYQRTSSARLRRADASEIAELALFLASDESRVLNGAIIAADAGWTAH